MTAFDSHSDPIPPPPRPIEYRDVDTRGWWRSMLAGVLLVVLGVWMLTNLYESVVVLAWLVGVSLVVGGIAEALVLGRRGAMGWLGWLGGVISVIAGVVVLAWPDITLWVLALVVGVSLLIAGGLRAITALADGDASESTVDLVLGALAVATGAVVLAWPEATLMVLALVFGIRAVGTGLVAIGIGWQLHRLAA